MNDAEEYNNSPNEVRGELPPITMDPAGAKKLFEWLMGGLTTSHKDADWLEETYTHVWTPGETDYVGEIL